MSSGHYYLSIWRTKSTETSNCGCGHPYFISPSVVPPPGGPSVMLENQRLGYACILYESNERIAAPSPTSIPRLTTPHPSVNPGPLLSGLERCGATQ
jgi:hypothetical protein